MSRPARKTAKVRLNLDMSPDMKDRLESLREKTAADSMSEVIRRAVTCYDYLVMNKGVVVVRDVDGVKREVVIL